jgi:hypothetical protein
MFLHKQILYHVIFMALFRFPASYNKFLQFFLLCFQYFNFFYPLNFMRHGLYGFDKKITWLLPCFRGFETCLLLFFHILGAYFR